MDRLFSRRGLLIVPVLAFIVGSLIVVLAASVPGTTRARDPDRTVVGEPTPAPSSTALEATAVTHTPFAPTPTQSISTLMLDTSIDSTATPTPLTGEMTPSPVPITVTAVNMASLLKEQAQSGEVADDDGPGELTMRDPVVTITDEYVELSGKAGSPGFGDLDIHVVCVPVVEDGELHFHVTAATVNGIPLPENMILQIESGLDQMLSQSLSGGCEVQEVIMSDGLITLVTLP